MAAFGLLANTIAAPAQTTTDQARDTQLEKALEEFQEGKNGKLLDVESAKLIADNLPKDKIKPQIEPVTKRGHGNPTEKQRRLQHDIDMAIEKMKYLNQHLPPSKPVTYTPRPAIVTLAAPPPPPEPSKSPEKLKNEPPKVYKRPTQRGSLPKPVYAGMLPPEFALGAKKIAEQGLVKNTEEERRRRHKRCPKCWGPLKQR